MKSNIHAALATVLLLGPALALASDSKVSLTGKEEVVFEPEEVARAGED